MLFSSITFLLYFLPAVLLLYYIAPASWKNGVLLLASLLFYAWGEPVYVFLMLLSILVNYFFGRLFMQGREAGLSVRKLRIHFVYAVGFNLLILFYFKYADMVISGINRLFSVQIPLKKLSLPIGISFYTFQALSYVIDVYLGKVKAQNSLTKFALYITMFPQLIAGPIVKYTDIETQLVKRRYTWYNFGVGTEYFIKGLAKKVLLANNIGAVFTEISQTAPENLTVVMAWLGAVSYSLQLYFDFSGYSDMAIGLGRMFGFHFPKNFDYPYISKSVTEFWRRWHISLSLWFREYVYIPLGGNRVGAGRHVFNILAVWMLTGLWHGASLNFLLWGIYYGIWLLLEKYIFGKQIRKFPIIGHIYTILIFIIGWVIFAFTDFSVLSGYLGTMFGLGKAVWISADTCYYLSTSAVLIGIGILAATPIPYRINKGLMTRHGWLAGLINICLFIAVLGYLVFQSYNPFLYFRF